MTQVMSPPALQHNAAIRTWFRVGGRADLLLDAQTIDHLRWALQSGQPVRILGQGANLLVADDGIDGIVVSLAGPELRAHAIDRDLNILSAAAGADLPQLLTATARLGLAGLEGLAGIPASVGGAVRMNAGGAFGQIASSVLRVFGLDSAGRDVCRERHEIPFGYRTSGLDDLIITRVDFALTPDDPQAIRTRLKEHMAYKKASQPMAARSAGCAFKNPTLSTPLHDIGDAGSRVSAGKLIDLAGCKGLRIGGAEVSERHANFLYAVDEHAKAADLIALMAEVERRVFNTFGVQLEREVVIWSRNP